MYSDNLVWGVEDSGDKEITGWYVNIYFNKDLETLSFKKDRT